jgi:hypothetical protein
VGGRRAAQWAIMILYGVYGHPLAYAYGRNVKNDSKSFKVRTYNKVLGRIRPLVRCRVAGGLGKGINIIQIFTMITVHFKS